MLEKNEHCIGFAYASSTIAKTLKHARTGCHYVETRRILRPFPTYAAALEFAQTLGTKPSWDSRDHPDYKGRPLPPDGPVY